MAERREDIPKLTRHFLSSAAEELDVEPKILNAAEAEIQGMEIEFVGAITTDFRIQAGIGYLDAEYVKLNPRGLSDLTIPVTLDTKFMNAPEWSFNLGLNYSTHLQFGLLEFRVDYA